jgi:hypothetical protein
MKPYEIPQNLMESHGTSWKLTEPYEISWNLTVPWRTSWNPMKGSGTLQNLLLADK